MGHGLYSCRQAAEGWASEARHWVRGSNEWNYAAGHFTQMVWKKTSQLGCGWANCPGRGVFMVCHYNEAGALPGGAHLFASPHSFLVGAGSMSSAWLCCWLRLPVQRRGQLS